MSGYYGSLNGYGMGEAPLVAAVLPKADGSFGPGVAVDPSLVSSYTREDKLRKDAESKCSPWQVFNSCISQKTSSGEITTSDCKFGCETTPLSLLRFPGMMIGKAIRPLFPSDIYGSQSEIAGHVVAALLLIGGVTYGFSKVGRR